MRKITICILLTVSLLIFPACRNAATPAQVAATTAPVYQFTSALCAGTDISVTKLVTENVSCLHDYTLQTSQMRTIENADVVIISGAGLESFLDEALLNTHATIDASSDIPLICHAEEHDHDSHAHSHAEDPHIWLSPENAKHMAQNICTGLSLLYPQHKDTFESNLLILLGELDALTEYASTQLADLHCRKLITFHDGFVYMAQAFDLEILHAIEEESGREASAAELIHIARIVTDNSLPCIFTELNGSTSAAQIISRETGQPIFHLDMAMSERDYFSAMYHNIDTLKEALK